MHLSQPCIVSGCPRMTKSHLTRLCSTHVDRKRNHGHPEQRPIRMTDLRPYLRKIDAWRRTVHQDLWPTVDRQWSAVLVPLAQENLEARGLNAKYRKEAAREVLALDAGLEDKAKIVNINLALWLFYQANKPRFVDANCFRHAIAKMTRGLCPFSKRRKFDLDTGAYASWASYCPPRTLQQLGDWLSEAYGTAGVVLAKHQGQTKRESVQQKDRLKELLTAIASDHDDPNPTLIHQGEA